MKPCARSSALLAQASQHLWLVLYHDVYQEFTYVHHTLHPAPSPPDAGRYTVSSRFGCQSGDCGYVVRGHLTARYLAAVPRRILLMEQQVWSMPDDQPCDLVSQHPITGWPSLFPTPLPALPLVGLATSLPVLQEQYGLTTFRKVDTNGLGALCPPVALRVHDRVLSRPCTRYGALLAQACQHLWLGAHHDVYREFAYAHHTIHPAPSLPDAGRYTIPSRFRCQSMTVGTMFAGSVRGVAFPHICVGYC